MSEDEYAEFLDAVPFGAQYLLPRKMLIEQSARRRQIIEAEIKAEAKTQPPIVEPPKVAPEPIVQPPKPVVTEAADISERVVEVLPPPSSADPLIEREHRRLQHLIKRMAEQSGYRAILEQPTADGQGRVDVGLESDTKRIACEICITTSPEHELANLCKCLGSDYDQVIMCSPERKTLEKIKALCVAELSEAERAKVIFLEPDALVLWFEQEAANAAGTVDRVKGYKVKVNFQPQEESDKESKRRAIAKVVLKSFRRDKPSQ
jgi:hypothetical protein